MHCNNKKPVIIKVGFSCQIGGQLRNIDQPFIGDSREGDSAMMEDYYDFYMAP